MGYLVTARKWRPTVFQDVIGQSHITTTLRNAIASNRLSHAYLFSGPRGVGKTTTARILAKAINCLNPKDFNPDNECEICKEITEGRNMDILEIDGASNRGIEEIRNLRESVKYVPSKNKYKVYVIDEVHMLTKEAFNALLKTLEEPPPHVIFIFATTENHKVPATILSRCQRFDFRRIGTDEIMRQLRLIADSDNISIDDDALLLIAKKGDGSMRDAQSTFDQIVSFCGKDISAQKIIEALNLVDQEIFFRTTDLIKTKDTKGGIALVEDIMNRGYDIKEFLSGLNEHFRNILIVLTTGSTRLIEVGESYKKRYEEDANSFTENDLVRLIRITNETENSIKWSQQPQFKLEVAIIQMIKMDSSVQVSDLLNRIEELKKKVDGGIKLEGKVLASPPSLGTRMASSDNAAKSYTPKSQDLSVQRIKEPIVINEQEPRAFPSSTNFTISLEEASEKWGAVVNKASQERIMLGSLLSSSRVLDCSNGSIKINFPDEFHLDFFRKNREHITDLAQNIYGAKLRLEATLQTKSNPKNETLHPLVAALKTQLGASRIDKGD
ncbi:MAG: DNA polymerase III subunit gamma/tau [Bacteroidetes bacterium]|nr:DNA polymerase III subunit gamma/tau [Bacteroidota bacterium]MBU1422754.1 DNA polymerase III subunit gamma/tau [Bacteroidota bacterium]MBU2472222.1 DNA polymerase III subunit gamma/tau [Bacteroidota bacterium]MBU2635532.1 DNA polymerase III subunit gamma/tau [Bacteroidota bacterium]